MRSHVKQIKRAAGLRACTLNMIVCEAQLGEVRFENVDVPVLVEVFMKFVWSGLLMCMLIRFLRVMDT